MNRWIKGLNFLLALLLFILIIIVVVKKMPTTNFNFKYLYPYRKMILKGWINTIMISIISLFYSMILGFIIYIMDVNKIPYVKYFLKYLAKIFNEVIFGSPLLVFVLITYYFIGTALNYDDRFILGISAISFYMAPYMYNLFKGAISSIDKDQHIASKIFGFTVYQKYRYIIIPQISKIILPPLTGNLSFIVKGSALVYMIGYNDLFYSISTAQSRSFAFTEGYILMLILYLLITIPLTRIAKYLQRRYIDEVNN